MITIDQNCQLFCGDCLDVMDRLIADGVRVDMTVTSPPYDNLRTYNGNNDQWNFDKFKQIAQKLYEITKDGGVVVWVVNDATIKGSETGTSFRQALFFKEIGFNLHDTMIWFKPNCFNFGSNNCYRQSFEYMFVFSKGHPKTINLIKDIKTVCSGKTLRGARKHANGTRDKTPDFVCSEYKKRFNVWNINVENKNSGHPAVFPLRLAADHIMTWSNTSDVILDPFMGSGTTGVACKNLNRKFIGIELDEKYFKIAENRIKGSLL